METELLAPAGDIEAAYSAFYFGADAVYLGLRRFSARADAANFSPEELDEITAYAHSVGKKVYVAVNTVAQESELPDVLETLSVCEACGVDAVIVQDWGIARLVRTTFPHLTLHGSTQMAVHNLAGALALKKMGFKRVVLARELSLSEIQKIQRVSGLEVEVFIHGALCYSYSGLCLFSSLTTGRSANRGKCVYSCRDTFNVNGRQYHPFSMKDLALEKEVLKLSGLSLKIEGRKKTALYVGAVTDYYRRILDTGRIDAGLTDNLKQIFARPWTKLHFNGKNKDVIEPDFVGHRGLPVGTVESVVRHRVTFRTNRPIARYDGIQIDVPGMEKPFGFSAEMMTVGGKKVFEVAAGQSVTLELPPHHPFIQRGCAVYLASSTRVKGAYPYEKPRPGAFKNRRQIDVDVFLAADKITACAGEVIAEITGVFGAAQNPTKTEEALRRAFDKTGDTPFQLGALHIHNPDGLFVPASAANNLRRDLYARIPVDKRRPVLPETPLLKRNATTPQRVVKTDDAALAKALPADLYDELIYVMTPGTTVADLTGLPVDKIRLALPTIMRPEEPYARTVQALWNAGFKRWEAGNPAGLSLIPRGADITLDAQVPMLNTQAVQQALEAGCSRITFSVEDTEDNIRALAEKTTQTCLVLYQDAPLFLSANCIRENACQDCPRGRLEIPLTNGKGSYTAVSENCLTTVLSNRPFCLPSRARGIPVGAHRIDFCYRRYTVAEALDIIRRVESGERIPRSFSGNFEKQFAS